LNEIGLYIHIPFCQSKCYYCDFNSYVNEWSIVPKYIEYLKKEIDIYVEHLKGYKVKTIFFGGGTPTSIDGKYIFEILSYIYKKLDISELLEVSIEANPKTVDDNKLMVYKDIGINRISLGLQSLDNRILKRIGRIHTREDFLQTYKLIRKWQFNNINVDIMFNLPEQSINDLLMSLKEVIALDVEHISFYSLKVEEGTPFYMQQDKGQLILPDEDVEREMYHKGIEMLEKNNYLHYEISNFAKKGYECKHNLIYWRLKPYIGLGLSAHSNFQNLRYGNVESFNNYFNLIENGKQPIADQEYIDQKMEMAEFMILGLRLNEGVNKSDFYKRFNQEVENVFCEELKRSKDKGLINIYTDRINLTEKGIDLSNIVFMELLP